MNLCPNCGRRASPRAIFCSTRCRMSAAYRRRKEAERLGKALQNVPSSLREEDAYYGDEGVSE